MSKRVLILGGGYTALWAYRSLAKRLRPALKRGEVELTVVTLDNFHAFHGWTGEVLSGIIPIQHSLTALRPLMPLAKLIHAEVERVDPVSQTVQIRLVGEGETAVLAYDHLLIATGSRDHLETAPGLSEYGHRLKRPSDMLALRSHLIHVLEQAEAVTEGGNLRGRGDSGGAGPETRFLQAVVAGGGFAGVEMSATILDLVRAARRYYPVLQEHPFRVILVHRGEALLPQLRPQYAKLADYATR
ncbi:MAG TPA: FAD-dependent oxidoreductase, partial [Symbiobacteriaceae bacterium]|nr:FAD-dependent oxidoreductase [Symbiobacteriaceae bacterium]